MKQINATTKSRASSQQTTSDNSRSIRSAQHRLIEACKCKDLDTISRILEDKPELTNYRDKSSRTLLHYTVILLARDDERQSADRDNLESHQSLECFNYITDRCDLSIWLQQDSDGLSILHLAVISSNVLLAKYIIFDHPHSTRYSLVCTLDNELHSPLHWAVITNNLECVRLLVEYAGPKLAHEPDLNGATPLHYATQTSDYPRYRRQLKAMLRGVAEAARNSSSVSVGEDAGKRIGTRREDEHWRQSDAVAKECDQGSLDVLEYLVKLPQVNLECMDKDRRTPLLWAASSGNCEAILQLAGNGANMASYDINRLSALHCSASHGYSDCLECLLNLNTAQSNGLQINQPDNLNCTPLFYSVLSGNIDCIEILLDRGAEKDWQDSKGRTAAHFAALKGQLSSLKLLNERGANLWLANKQGDLPLHYAIKSGRQQVVKWLLENSPYEHAVNAINNFGRAPIHLAILKGNEQMTNYLIGCGANINQLVKVRDRVGKSGRQPELKSLVNGSSVHQTKTRIYHYETALDMAKNLKLKDCLQLLSENGALSAAQVISRRVKGSNELAGRSLFDLQSVEGPSPIGFETSSSTSDSPSVSRETRESQQQQHEQRGSLAGVGHYSKLFRPPPGRTPQTDSTESSALSQSSLTKVRSVHQPELQHKDYDYVRVEPNQEGYQGEYEKPYKGGISYNNQLINASIKCRVYNRDDAQTQIDSRSFPLTRHQLQAIDCNRSGPRIPGQEIITNVNVFTPTCQRCNASRHDRQCCLCLPLESQAATSGGGTSEKPVETNAPEDAAQSDEASDSEEEHSEGKETVVSSRRQVPESNSFNQHQRFLPPSQTYEQHLPVIVSEQERSTSNTSEERHSSSANEAESCNNAGRPKAAGLFEGLEPRFDRVERPRRSSRRTDRYRQRVRSPVADYIHSAQNEPSSRQSSNANRTSQGVRSKQAAPHSQRLDLSQVKAKVNSYRNTEDHVRSKSMSVLSDSSKSTKSQICDTSPRSVSRQTVIVGRRSSLETDELASSVERTIRKYKQERKLFEELQNLKRNQIRSGQASEALLVKRLVDHFRNDSSDLLGLEIYHGPYTYESYESFLYDQLRKLSQSNAGKLNRRIYDYDQSRPDQRDYLEEDMRAELELRRVIENGSACEVEGLREDGERKDPELKETEHELEAEKEASVQTDQASSAGENEHANNPEPAADTVGGDKELEVEEERIAQAAGDERPDSEDQDEQHESSSTNMEQIRSRAHSLASSILVDSLGNLARSNSGAHDLETGGDEAGTPATRDDGEIMEPTGETRLPAGRRCSIVNIGNKMERIYHDVAIEIDPAIDSEHASSEGELEVREESLAKCETRELDAVTEDETGSDGLDQQRCEDKQGSEDEAGDAVEQVEAESPEAPAANLDLKVEEKPKTSAGRRASLPPWYKREASEKLAPRLRRASSTDKAFEVKKVFNGHDLDQMRQTRSPMAFKSSKVGLPGEERRVEESQLEINVGGDGGGQAGIGASAEDEDSVAKVGQVEKPASPRRRLARSRLRKVKYKPKVPIEEVKQRWASIRSSERKRARQLGDEGESSLAFNDDIGSEELASSKPKLRQGGDHSGDFEAQGDKLNFTLLYEINKESPRAEQRSRVASPKRIDWCERRIVKIVDVRTLKRTLSLPESLIYSNELLKRFNILKL